MTVIALRPTAAPPGPRPPRLRPHDHPPAVTLRELGPDDADVLDAVFAGLSAHSRYLRFHGATPRLTPGVRRALTAVDGSRHVAVAAFGPDGEPVGIARLIGTDAHHAELAIAVVDAWQGRGVGRQLLRAVAARGREIGWTRLVADVLAENTAMRVLLASVLPIISVVTTGPETTVTADLGATVPAVAVAVPAAA